MSEKKIRVVFQESGGGWGNPLLGQVFDSDRDVAEEEIAELRSLVERCSFPNNTIRDQQLAVDVSGFELTIQDEDKNVAVTGDMLAADKNMRELVNFIKKRSRKKLLE